MAAARTSGKANGLASTKHEVLISARAEVVPPGIPLLCLFTNATGEYHHPDGLSRLPPIAPARHLELLMEGVLPC